MHRKEVLTLSIIYNRIIELCNTRGISGTAMCKEIGISPNILTELKNGRRNGLSSRTASTISDYFDVSTDYLLGNSDIKKTPKGIQPLGELVNFNVLASVRAGYDGSAVVEYSDETFPFMKAQLRGYDPAECAVLRVKGDSMFPRFCDGDYILVHMQPSVDSGDTAVIIYNGDEATVKKVYYKNGEDWLDLVPANPEYQTKRIEGSDLEICRVFGKVIGLTRMI